MNEELPAPMIRQNFRGSGEGDEEEEEARGLMMSQIAREEKLFDFERWKRALLLFLDGFCCAAWFVSG